MPKTNKPKNTTTDVVNISLEPLGANYIPSELFNLYINESGVDPFLFETRTVSSASDYAAYASASDVAFLCRNLLASASGFSTSTSPTLTAINGWLSSGCGIIETQLNAWGYATPVSENVALFDWLRHLNTLFAAGYAELSRLNITVSPGERTRGQLFLDQFNAGLKSLQSLDLIMVGASALDTGITHLGAFVGGVSVSNKATHVADGDRVKPKFYVGVFNMPGTTKSDAG